ncbi:hypothetical protein [Polluticaenibacter yanchengensis]|uniref:Uncharacterized protein n=1 Tax=Polluticaenibacter yanchengensis TaxID=3014562 RepID=A0ABT4UHY4_9BACT|nr:hypothetical protein [Chitinophagaceae bacterium LY-5]
MNRTIVIARKYFTVVVATAMVLFCSLAVQNVFAAKDNSKTKTAVAFKFSTFDFKKFSSNIFSAETGVVYKNNSTTLSTNTNGENSVKSVISIKKGNKTMMIPTNQKVIMPKFQTPVKPSF